VVNSQIDTLTFNLSFGHNLCCKYSNGSWKLILDIYVWWTFQWYKEVFNPMNFEPWNWILKIWIPSGTLTLKVGVHLGVCELIPSHFLALIGVWMWILDWTLGKHLSMPLALVMKPRLRSWQWHLNVINIC
jgi:hypothetical protein